ncbi:MAG: phytoene/squalene synthase family protein [Propionibacteriaceae bacterium]
MTTDQVGTRQPTHADGIIAAEGYRRAALLTREFGTTYFWGAALLPKERRKHVYAVYALCRLADDIVDVVDDGADPATVAATLTAFGEHFRSSLAAGRSDDPVLAAVVHTALTCGIDPECFDRFFAAMAMDLTTTSYATFDDLCGYMEGSAAVIGEMMLPVLEPQSVAAYEPARYLGLAFQLTNFLRDVDEDLDRGRIYIPTDDLQRFEVDIHARRVTEPWRDLMRFEITRNRELYELADPGITLLPAASQRCVGTARVLYAQILDRIEAADYDVFSGRVRVPTWKKGLTAARSVVRRRAAVG